MQDGIELQTSSGPGAAWVRKEWPLSAWILDWAAMASQPRGHKAFNKAALDLETLDDWPIVRLWSVDKIAN